MEKNSIQYITAVFLILAKFPLLSDILKNDKVNKMTPLFFQKCSEAENIYVEDKSQSIENIIKDAC